MVTSRNKGKEEERARVCTKVRTQIPAVPRAASHDSIKQFKVNSNCEADSFWVDGSSLRSVGPIH